MSTLKNSAAGVQPARKEYGYLNPIVWPVKQAFMLERSNKFNTIKDHTRLASNLKSHEWRGSNRADKAC